MLSNELNNIYNRKQESILVRSSSPPQPAILLEGVGMFSVSVVVSTSRGALLPSPPSSSSHVPDSEQLSTIITSSAVVLDTAELVDATVVVVVVEVVVVVDVVEVVHGFCTPMILKPK